jgi:tripartite-type tricarboxylate transporter receptor subunit TctC
LLYRKKKAYLNPQQLPSPSVISPYLASGRVRALLTSKKIPEHPNIPTLTELGYKRDIPSVWNAFFIPAGVSDSVKKILVSALERSIKSPDVINIMQKIGYVHDYRSGDEVKKSMREEYLTLKELIKTMGPIAK